MARELLANHHDAEGRPCARFELGAVHASGLGVNAQIIRRGGAELGADVGVGVS